MTNLQQFKCRWFFEISGFFEVWRHSKSKLPLYSALECGNDSFVQVTKNTRFRESSWKLGMDVKSEYISGSAALTLSAFCFGSPPKFRKQPKFKWLPVLRKSVLFPTYGRATMKKTIDAAISNVARNSAADLLRAWLPSLGIRFDFHANDATERTKKGTKGTKLAKFLDLYWPEWSLVDATLYTC